MLKDRPGKPVLSVLPSQTSTLHIDLDDGVRPRNYYAMPVMYRSDI
jgi:hypothetical protein